QALARMARVEGQGGDVHVGNDLARLLNLADKLAQQRQDSYIASELVWLAALQAKTEVARYLGEAGVTEAALLAAIESIRGGERVNDQEAEGSRQALERFTIDLTERAESGKLDPVIGRDDEIRRTIQVL